MLPAMRLIEAFMPIRLEEAELLIPHHFPSPRTRPFCHRFSWMGHYAIRLSQAERLWRSLSGIWKLICCPERKFCSHNVHGACLAPELIEQFVEVVTPIADYSYRWKLNTGCKKSKEERADLMSVSEKPILTFTIDFETAKRYREANKLPHQFRRAAWTDLTVEVYL